MRYHDSRSRSLPFLHFTLAATALALVGTFGQPAFAAEPPQARSGRLPAAGAIETEGRTLGAQPGCTLCIVGATSVQWNGASGSFHADRVENRRTRGVTGPLALQVQLQSTYPDMWRDMGVGEHEFSDRFPLNPLPAGGSYSNINSGTIGFYGSKVPAGEYWVLILLHEGFGWSVNDYVVISDKVSCDGSSCAVMGSCSNARLAGNWGYTKTGTVILPTGAVPFASVGRLDFDAAGNVSGTHEASVGGNVGKGTLNGTFALNSDCIGTMTIGVYDQSGNLLRTVAMTLVLDDKARELRGLMTSLVLPNGISLPSVITGNARRLFLNQADGQ